MTPCSSPGCAANNRDSRTGAVRLGTRWAARLSAVTVAGLSNTKCEALLMRPCSGPAFSAACAMRRAGASGRRQLGEHRVAVELRGQRRGGLDRVVGVDHDRVAGAGDGARHGGAQPLRPARDQDRAVHSAVHFRGGL